MLLTWRARTRTQRGGDHVLACGAVLACLAPRLGTASAAAGSAWFEPGRIGHHFLLLQVQVVPGTRRRW